MGGVYHNHSKMSRDHSSAYCKDERVFGNNGQPLRLGHLIAFNVKEDTEHISGILTVEFDYYSEDGSIKYRDMHYSNPRLIKHIEGNPRVMKNIDSYIRKNLLESEYGLKL
ncbi:MAG TPA: hypothetical protein VLD84_10350 [Nitrososphaeraceae archaeon]|nr:hypothetical protein [Nitrososphaeraceae archaeon]